MVIDPLLLTVDAHTWQALAHEQHAQLIQTRALIANREALIAKLTAQIAQLKRLQFTAKAESFSPEQRQLFEDTLAEELYQFQKILINLCP
jgi:uncharacterized protein YhbP (UPF0306 family)